MSEEKVNIMSKITPHYLEVRLTPEEHEVFRKHILKLIKENNTSVLQVARDLGIQPATLRNFCYGVSHSRFIAANLANYFHLNPEEFVGEKVEKKKQSFFGGWSCGIVLALLSIPLTLSLIPKNEVEAKEIDFDKYIVESEYNAETEALGVIADTDFVPGYYEFNPYPDAIEKHIEATAYCYGTTTCTGKKVREGYAAMSKRYLGMTAIVYEQDECGQPIDYIGTYEIEDTGGDERIKNGNCIDIYIPDYKEAKEFGRKQVVVYLIDAKG